MKKKAAWILLGFGIACLIVYLLLIFNLRNESRLVLILLAASVGCNAAALNLFILSKERRRRKERD